VYVLVRKPGDTIVVPVEGGQLTITVLESKSGASRLGFEGPVRVKRGETLKELKDGRTTEPNTSR
jgi:sRNA-binding carbon storage regulator CsrA